MLCRRAASVRLVCLSILCAVAAAATLPRAVAMEIVTLGDSITKGVRSGVTAEQTFAALVEQRLRASGHDVRIANVGIGGERTDQALKRLDRDVVAKRPQIVTIMYGTNDSYVDAGKTASRLPLDDYRKNLGELVARLRAVGATPVLMTEPRWGRDARKNGVGENPNRALEPYVAACREVAAELQVPLVDHFDHWTQAEAAGTDLGAWTTDQCHPNPAGHRELADRIVPVVEALLKSKPVGK